MLRACQDKGKDREMPHKLGREVKRGPIRKLGAREKNAPLGVCGRAPNIPHSSSDNPRQLGLMGDQGLLYPLAHLFP